MPIIDTEKLEAYAQMIYERENQFNTFTLKTIARRIKATGQLSAYDQEALKNIADISGDMDKITKELARITKMNVEDIEKVYAQTINDGVNSYKPLYDFKGMQFKPIAENEYAMALVHHWSEMTAEKMINLSNTKAIGFTNANGKFTDIQGTYQRVIDDAVVAVSSGPTDFNSAMKGTIERLGGSGVVTNYGSGVTRSLEGMVRQNLLWGAKQAAQSYDDYVSDELGLDGFEVDAHPGCRQSHMFMQGQIYSYKGDKVVKGVLYEDGAKALKALEEYGCLHFKMGVLLGVSEPRYSKSDLARIEKETTDKIEYNGKEKTLYEWKQTQRRLEREYRKAQTQSDTFKESGNKVAAKDYKNKADAIKTIYDDMTNKVPGLYDSSERMRTYFKGTKSITNISYSGVSKTYTNPVRSNKNYYAKLGNTENPEVHYLGKIDRSIYSCVTEDIQSDDFIITNERISHIKAHHPNDYELYQSFMVEAVLNPDYIIETKKINSAFILKSFEQEGKKFKMILRLKASTDNPEYKNSIITFMKINDKEWNRLINNKKILYKKE